MTEDKNLVNLSNAGRPGDDTYKKVIEQIQSDKVCPFCPDQLSKYHKNPIIKVSALWTLTTNMYPYKNAKYHFLLILRNHKNDTKELSPEEWSELHEHTNWLVTEYKLPGGTLMMRCGDTTHTGASVTHLHAHFVSPDFDNPNREPVMARLG
jgi:diadenosine tetraphosphate (Ap4A) HIT family hydrolase